MYKRVVADRHIAANVCGRIVIRAMDHGAILDIGFVTDLYIVHITPDHRVKPNGAVIADFHVADYGCIGGDKAALAEGRGNILYR